MTETEDYQDETSGKIAVVGMAGRFPKAADLDAFWQILRDGTECVSFFSEEALREAGVSPVVRTAESFVPARAILEDPEYFDAQFFGMSPKEAVNTDPQQRLFLETCWHALEHAACDPGRYEGLIGVYGGNDVNTYALSNLVLGKEGLQTLIGNDKDYLATRVAFKLDLKGPAVTVQTACSTSLVAVQMACQALLGYQCDTALAGGVGVAFPQRAGYLFQEGGILSPDGHCRPFDAEAGGTVGGDGVGVVVLKRYEDACSDGDTIHAVILGAAVNNDGADKVGFTAPSVTGQAEVIAMAQAAAEVDPETISYVETHGTATGLGDPIEFSALRDVFEAGTDRKQFCAIGSLKSNVGHMNSAAGIGSLLKTILALKHKWLPPSLHYEKPNPMIDFENRPFYVQATSAPWECEGPRRAGVSSFGIGGTNAHIILEEAPEQASENVSGTFPLIVSAATPSALDTLVDHLRTWHAAHPGASLAEVANTLVRGRSLSKHRRMVACDALADGLAALGDPARCHKASGEVKNEVAAFMFSGQGAQYTGMGRGLYAYAPVFRAVMDQCAEHLRPILGHDLRELLWGDEEGLLNRTEITQPALFAFEVALARQLIANGIVPEAMIGHSVGEYVAAHLAGVFSLEDGLDLIAERGRLIGALPGGAMLAVGSDELPAFDDLSIAAENGPAARVLSGPEAAIDRARQILEERGVPCARLHTSHAFHSAMMDGALDGFAKAVSRITLNAPEIPFLSNVTGTWITEEDARDPGYWVRHIRAPVRFGSGVTELLREPDRILIEVGPGTTLCTLARKSQAWRDDRAVFETVRHPREERADQAVLVAALGQAALAHVPVDWDGCFPAGTKRIPLPRTPFQRTRFWQDPHKALQTAFDQSEVLMGKRSEVASWLYQPTWKRGAPVREHAPSEGTILFLRGETALDDALQERFSATARVVPVRRGQAFAEDDSGYTINPALLSDVARLAEVAPTKIVHTWLLDDRARSFEEVQADGFFSLVWLSRVFGPTKREDPLVLEIVTRQTVAVLGDEPLDPARTTLLGPCQVIPQEYHRLMTRQIDVVPDTDVALLLAEIERPVSERRVALRGRHRWVELFDPIPAAADPDPKALLREKGVYLISGGLGGIGLVLAEWLADHLNAKLVLTSRKGLLARDQWDRWLETHDDRDPVSFRIRKVRHLEALGSEVLVLSADIADENHMRQVCDTVRERFGKLNGVFHAAGVVDQAMLAPIAELTPEQTAQHFRPKIQGTDVLARIVPDDLDFCMLFSSVATVLGGLGGTSYVAANAYLDSVVDQMNRETGFPWIAVDWDAWFPSEQSQLTKPEVPAWARFAILPPEGCEALARILASGTSRCVVSTADLQLRLDMLLRTDDGDAAEHASAQEAETRHTRPIQEVDYIPPRDELEEVLCEMWAALLGIDKVGIHDNFFRLGGDSLVAIQLSTRLRDAFDVDINVNHLFEEPTIAALADKVRACQAVGGADLDVLGDKLDLIENMSEAEVAAMLAELEGEA